jgi:hypothetical protein
MYSLIEIQASHAGIAFEQPATKTATLAMRSALGQRRGTAAAPQRRVATPGT